MTTPSLDLDREQARTAVGGLSVALGAAATLAPVTTARLLGVNSAAGGAGPLFVRMVGVRNAVMGLRTLQATDADQQRAALQAGFVVGVVDATAVLLAARKGAITKKAAFGILVLLGAIAAAGVVAAADE